MCFKYFYFWNTIHCETTKTMSTDQGVPVESQLFNKISKVVWHNRKVSALFEISDFKSLFLLMFIQCVIYEIKLKYFWNTLEEFIFNKNKFWKRHLKYKY